jgi:hypothetical protein
MLLYLFALPIEETVTEPAKRGVSFDAPLIALLSLPRDKGSFFRCGFNLHPR